VQHGPRPAALDDLSRLLPVLMPCRSCLQAECTSLFDRIIKLIGDDIEKQRDNNGCLAYWCAVVLQHLHPDFRALTLYQWHARHTHAHPASGTAAECAPILLQSVRPHFQAVNGVAMRLAMACTDCSTQPALLGVLLGTRMTAQQRLECRATHIRKVLAMITMLPWLPASIVRGAAPPAQKNIGKPRSMPHARCHGRPPCC
jgi:hypothetical protein